MTVQAKTEGERERGEPVWRARLFEASPYVAATLAFAAGAFTLIAVATPALPQVRGLDVRERLVSCSRKSRS